MFADEEDFSELPTLEDMIKDAVAEGIAQYEKKRIASEKKASRPKKSNPAVAKSEE